MAENTGKLAGAAKVSVIGGGSVGGIAAIAVLVLQHFGHMQAPPTPASNGLEQRFDDHMAEDSAWKRDAEASRRALWKALRGTAAPDDDGG